MMDKCKIVRENILEEVKKEIEQLGAEPTLAIIKCNDDYASKVYVNNKIKTCESVGIKVTLVELDPNETDFTHLANVILNCNIKHTSTILQLPLDDKFKNDEHKLLNLIEYDHDIDGLTNVNKLKLADNNDEALVPCTALAVFKIMEHEFGKSDFSGKKVCIVNRSNLIGKPLMSLLLNHNATVTIAHSRTEDDINDFLWNTNYDVVVTGIGKNIIDETTMDRTVIIDCGISRDKNGKLLRDVQLGDFSLGNTYYEKVGTVTTACVALNVLKSWKLQNGLI